MHAHTADLVSILKSGLDKLLPRYQSILILSLLQIIQNIYITELKFF